MEKRSKKIAKKKLAKKKYNKLNIDTKKLNKKLFARLFNESISDSDSNISLILTYYNDIVEFIKKANLDTDPNAHDIFSEYNDFLKTQDLAFKRDVGTEYNDPIPQLDVTKLEQKSDAQLTLIKDRIELFRYDFKTLNDNKVSLVGDKIIEKLKHIKSFKAFNEKFNFNDVSNNHDYKYKFQTENGREYEVTFGEPLPWSYSKYHNLGSPEDQHILEDEDDELEYAADQLIYLCDYTTEEKFDILTGEGETFGVFQTIAKIIIKFINDINPDKIVLENIPKPNERDKAKKLGLNTHEFTNQRAKAIIRFVGNILPSDYELIVDGLYVIIKKKGA